MVADKSKMESIPTRIHRAVQLTILATLLAVLGTLVWQWAKAGAVRDAYRARLGELEATHNQLVNDYNLAIRRTAVCEVRQVAGKLTILVRTADGQTEEIPVAFDPTHEIYFDFVCLDGHLLMRRVYDDQTKPKDGTPIQSKLVRVDWSKHVDDRGLVLYRPLPEEGRYALKASGNGALTLEKMSAQEISHLEHAPKLRRFEPASPMQNAGQEPGVGEVFKALWR